MTFDDGPEVPLAGGDVTEGVVRIGGTVRRPRSGVSDAVERLLRHLEAAGFDGAPRFLGRDAHGRDVLSFVEGEVAGRPWPAWVADDDRAGSVGALLRRYHEAVAPLGVPDWARAIPQPALPDAPVVAAPAPALVGHRDLTPENVVFRGGRAAALIDFDLLRASAPVEDVENAVQWWAPWMPVADREPAVAGVDALGRARRIVDAYGLGDADRALLPRLALQRAGAVWHSMRWRAEHLGGGWARMWAEGVGDRIRRREVWLAERQDELAEALLR